VYRVGYLGFGGTAPGPHTRAFSEALSGLGYVHGKNLVIEYRWPGDRTDHLPALALDLVRVGVGVIVAPGNQPVLATKAATTTIPIVMPWVLEPVETGIVESLARPGGNVTGLTWEEGTEQVKKKLQLFKELVPTASRAADQVRIRHQHEDR
jgi:putative ABC transport system substrate-binding protein